MGFLLFERAKNLILFCFLDLTQKLRRVVLFEAGGAALVGVL